MPGGAHERRPREAAATFGPLEGGAPQSSDVDAKQRRIIRVRRHAPRCFGVRQFGTIDWPTPAPSVRPTGAPFTWHKSHPRARAEPLGEIRAPPVLASYQTLARPPGPETSSSGLIWQLRQLRTDSGEVVVGAGTTRSRHRRWPTSITAQGHSRKTAPSRPTRRATPSRRR